MAALGFVGLGIMGTPIVPRLLGAGHQVVGHNRTAERAEALVALGMGGDQLPHRSSDDAGVLVQHPRDRVTVMLCSLPGQASTAVMIRAPPPSTTI